MDCNHCENVMEILKDRLYFSLVSGPKKLRTTKSIYYVTFDDDLKYRHFFRDFGPLNIACLYKYCCRMTKLLNNFRGRKKVVHYTSDEANKKVNAAYLIGSFAVLCLKMSPIEVYQLLAHFEPYKQYVDALQRTSVHTIRLYDCLRAVAKGFQYNLCNFNDFNVEEYDTFDQYDNGNMNWIVPRKFLAFIGPTDVKFALGHSPSFYVNYFMEHDVRSVIRLNEKQYDSSVFTERGIEHFDLFFDDGSVPSMEILLNFLRITETAPAAIAVHCKAGLGRTGTLICCYLMKHYMMTAREAVGWNRICRSGSVTGAQQAFLEDHENWLWKSGNDYRMRHYGEEMRMPQHKYGIYSKQWPIDRNRIISESKKKAKQQENMRMIKELDERQYLRHVRKLLSAVQSFDRDKFRKSLSVPTRRF